MRNIAIRPSWLVSRLRKMNRDPRLVACLAEAEELIRIFVASVRTTEPGTQYVMPPQKSPFGVRCSVLGFSASRFSSSGLGRWALDVGR
jgi:hypothetical protein